MKKILLRKITALLVIVGLIEIIIFSIISYTAKHNDTTKHLMKCFLNLKYLTGKMKLILMKKLNYIQSIT